MSTGFPAGVAVSLKGKRLRGKTAKKKDKLTVDDPNLKAGKPLPKEAHLATLCAICCSIFENPRTHYIRYDLAQTYAELEQSASARDCHLCYLRWNKRVKNNENVCQTALRYYVHDFLEPREKRFGLMFVYTNAVGIEDIDAFYALPSSDIPGCTIEPAIVMETSDLGVLEKTTSTGSDQSLDQVDTWYKLCRDKHQKCSQNDIKAELDVLPTRLIYLGDDMELEPRLVETNTLSSKVDYVTVSHCWGQQRIICLTRNNLADFKHGVPAAAISKTFSEAMLVTKRLAISYIWIDSLCIIQQDIEDWRKESFSMSRVYKNAVFNIAATGAKDRSIGCFTTRSHLDKTLCWIAPSWGGRQNTKPKLYFLIDLTSWKKLQQESPLNQRAWVVQERHLARRIISFAQGQIYWECCEHTASETFPSDLPSNLRTGQYNVRSYYSVMLSLGISTQSLALGVWNSFVREYSSRELTEERDKLVAIAGLARELEQYTKYRYLAGLWEYDLPRSLLWRVADLGERINTFQASSWSWASLNGIVNIPAGYAGEDILISILEVQTSAVGVDQMGQICSGFLKILCYLAYGVVTTLQTSSTEFGRQSDFHLLIKNPDPGTDQLLIEKCFYDTSSDKLSVGQMVYCLPIMRQSYDRKPVTICGLLLQLKQDGMNTGLSFRRIGTFNHPEPLDRNYQMSMEQQKPKDDFFIEPSGYDRRGVPQYAIIVE